MFSALLSAVRFWWRASAGYRLRPWCSPYLRWRMETFSGQKAESLRLRDFIRVALAERRQVWRFFHWVAEMEALTSGAETR